MPYLHDNDRLIENGYDVFGFSCSVCTVYIAPFCQRKLIKTMGCGRGVLRRAHWHALVRTRRQRKRKFFSIDVVVGLLLAFSTSMKAEVRWYQKRVFVSSVYTCVLTRFSCLRFSSLHFCERFCLETFQLSDSPVFGQSRVNETRISKPKIAFLVQNVFV